MAVYPALFFFYQYHQGRRQGVTTENFSRGPKSQGGPGGPQEALYSRIFFSIAKPRHFPVYFGPK